MQDQARKQIKPIMNHKERQVGLSNSYNNSSLNEKKKKFSINLLNKDLKK